MSAANFGKRELTRTSSLKPFEKTDPEFYNEDSINPMWKKDLQRVKTEKIILYGFCKGGKFFDQNSFFFGKSEVFSKTTASTTANTQVTLTQQNESPKNLKIASVNRNRDYHSENKVIPKEKPAQKTISYYESKLSKGKKAVPTVSIDFKPKEKTPMHFKLYDSQMQDDLKLKKRPEIPKSHPSFKKEDDTYKPPETASFKKKLDCYKTSYNFLKNFH